VREGVDWIQLAQRKT